MDCKDFRSKPFLEFWNSDQQDEWKRHQISCQACGDRSLKRRLLDLGFDPDDYPCIHLAAHLIGEMKLHWQEQPLITYDERFDEYSINVGNDQQWAIRNCPWCGFAFPKSKRVQWFDGLSELGFDDPDNQNIPIHYTTNEWRQTTDNKTVD